MFNTMGLCYSCPIKGKAKEVMGFVGRIFLSHAL
jgi:hypothetical protein